MPEIAIQEKFEILKNLKTVENIYIFVHFASLSISKNVLFFPELITRIFHLPPS